MEVSGSLLLTREVDHGTESSRSRGSAGPAAPASEGARFGPCASAGLGLVEAPALRRAVQLRCRVRAPAGAWNATTPTARHPAPTCSGLTSLGTMEPEPRTQGRSCRGHSHWLPRSYATEEPASSPKGLAPRVHSLSSIDCGTCQYWQGTRPAVVVHPGNSSPVARLASMRSGRTRAKAHGAVVRPGCRVSLGSC